MELNYWSFRSSSRRGEDGVRWVDGGRGCIVILARCKFNFIREQENLVQHPSKVIINPLGI